MKWAQDINIKQKITLLLSNNCVCASFAHEDQHCYMLVDLLFSVRASMSLYLESSVRCTWASSTIHSCQWTYFQLPVITEPQTDPRKVCPESLICCYTFLLGPELQLLSPPQTAGAPDWWEHLPGHVPACCTCPSCTAPALSLQFPHAPVNGAKRGKSAYTEHLKKATDPKDWEGLWKSPQSSCFCGLFSLSWG